MITVKVPATSANIGPGFDSIGVALSLYNTVSAEETDSGLTIDILDEMREYLPRDGRNLVFRAMIALFREADYTPRGLHITLNSEIPLTRGLGSSSASIIGGVIAANEICGAGMTRGDIITFASGLEGHPDNVTPAMTGGMAVAVVTPEKTHYSAIPIDGDRLKFIAMIPDFILRTKKARRVLPGMVTHADAVYNTGRAALLTALMMSGDYEGLRVALDDRLHQPYRKRFIRGVDKIFEKARECGAVGSYISGAGPAVISLVTAEYADGFTARMTDYIQTGMENWSLTALQPDNTGAVVIKGGN